MERDASAGWVGVTAPESKPIFRKENSESELSTVSSDSFSVFQHMTLASPTSPATRGASPNDGVGWREGQVKEESNAAGGTLQESDIQDILNGKFRCISDESSSSQAAFQLPGHVSSVLKNEGVQRSRSDLSASSGEGDKQAEQAQVWRRATLVGKGQRPTLSQVCMMCGQDKCVCSSAMLLGKTSSSEQITIERPISAPEAKIVFENERSAQRRAQMRLFSHKILARYWEAGYSAEVLLRIFRSLPSDLRTAIWAGLDAMSFLSSLASGAGEQAVEPNAQAPAPVTFKIPDAGPGTLVMGWDPGAQVRTYVSANNTCGVIARVHIEEFLTRIANNELNMMQSELEWLCTTIDDLISGSKPGNVRYLRYAEDFRNPESSDKCKLIKMTVVNHLDVLGRGVMSSTTHLEVASDEEYDQALSATPELCRPFSAMLGDVIVFKPLIDMANGARMQVSLT